MSAEILAMSDEEFLKLNEPPASPGVSTESSDSTVTDEQRAAAEQAAAASAQTQADADAAAAELVRQNEEAAALAEEQAAASKQTSNGDTVAGENGEQTPTVNKPAETTPPADQTGKVNSGGESKEGVSSVGSEAGGQGETPDYKGFFEQVMSPLKANGKTITLKDPKEAIQLMQMGANYTRKMQELAPHRKVLMMLESNGLLDEGQLSFAIDLVKKNPEAIKKLVKDSGIDPQEIDTNVEPNYQAGNHRVSDQEASFATVLDDVKSKDGGTETLRVIQSQWDQASKDVLWANPDLMDTIHEQRASGIYGRIADEVERQKTLGAIPAQMPFIQAYKAVGDKLADAGAFADLVKTEPSKPQEFKTPVATRAAVVKPVVKNGDKVSAASATRATPKTAEMKVNPLSLSDDDFMKQMANRL